MAQLIIDTGAAANDGTGDPLRTAFTDTNLNFTAIYTAGPVDSNVQITNNTILTIKTSLLASHWALSRTHSATKRMPLAKVSLG